MKSLSPSHINVSRSLQASADRIIQCVNDKKYCAVLGPRFSGKSELLDFVEETLMQEFEVLCTSQFARDKGDQTI